MTPARYIVARLAQGFGIHRRAKRLSDASSEMHLLRDAELFLGRQIWEHVSEIEDLSVEYWNLRKLTKERETVSARIEECREILDKAQEERASLLSISSEPQQEILGNRAAILAELEVHARRRDEIVSRARRVRRTYEGLTTKLKVIRQEPEKHTADIDEAVRRLEELKYQFAELKKQRIEIAKLIDAGDEKLDHIDAQISELKNKRREDASEAFHIIGEANREISGHRAELGLIDTQMRQLFAEIGRYVSRNDLINPVVGKAVASHRPLVDVMRALRRSIAYNHRLTGQS